MYWRRKIFAFLIALLFSEMMLAQNIQLLPVVVGGKYGFIDTKGNLVLEPKYDYVFDFGRNNFSVVSMNGRYGVIDIDGNEIIACREDSIKIIDSVFAIKKDDLWGLMDYRGKAITNFQYEELEADGNGFFKFRSNEMYGILSQQGKVIVSPEYDHFSFRGNLIYTYSNNYIGLYDIQGKKYLDAVNDEIIWKYNNIVFYEKNGKMGYASLLSGKVIPAVWDEISLLDPYNYSSVAQRNYEVIVSHNGKQGLYLSCNDSLCLDPKYEGFSICTPGYITFKEAEKTGLISLRGKLIFKPVYDDIEYLGGGYFRISQDNKSGIADTLGHILVSPKYSNIFYLQQDDNNRGLFSFISNAKAGLIRSDSVELAKPEYSSIESLSSGFLVAKVGAKCGILGYDGKLLLPLDYDKINFAVDNVHLIQQGKMVGLVNTKGKLLAKPVYDKITVVDRTYKAYSGNNLEIIWLNDQYEISDRVAYEGIPSVHVIDPNARVYTWTQPTTSNTVTDRMYQFFYSPEKAKWGLKEIRSGQVIIEPQFDKIGSTIDAQFKYVYINIDTTHYEIDGCRFYCLQACGLVDMINGNLVLKPEYLDIKINLNQYFYWFARVVSITGEIGYANEFGIFLNDYTYISEIKSREARVNIGGELIITDKQTENTVCALNVFINNFTCRLRFADGYTRNTVLSEKSLLACDGGYWGQLYFDLNKAKIEKFDWVSEDFSGFYIVRSNNQSVLIRDRSFIKINGMNYDKYLTYQNLQPLFVVSKNNPKYGFVRKEGSLVSDIEFDFACNFSEGYAAVKKKDHWGFVDQNSNIVIPIEYIAARSFSEGLAAIKTGTKWGYINTNGDTVIVSQFNKAGDFKGGLAAVRKSGKSYYINSSGEKVFEEEFIKCQDFKGDFAVASNRDGTGVINKSGEWVIHPKYDKVNLLDPENGIAIVSKNSKYGLVNLEGQKLTPMKYNAIRPPSDGLLAVRSGSLWGFINKTGKIVILLKYVAVKDFADNRAVVKPTTKWGAIDRKGNEIIPFNYLYFDSYSNGICFAGIKKNSNCMLDTNGTILKESSQLSVVKGFSEGKSVVMTNYHNICYMDRNGNFLFDKVFDAAKPFDGSLAMVRVDGEWGIINNEGSWIMPPMYDSIRNFSEDLAVIVVMKHEGVADSRGNIYVKPEYHSIEMAPYGLIRVRKYGAMGYVDLNGKEIWKPTK
jgi:hypothetical protein